MSTDESSPSGPESRWARVESLGPQRDGTSRGGGERSGASGRARDGSTGGGDAPRGRVERSSGDGRGGSGGRSGERQSRGQRSDGGARAGRGDRPDRGGRADRGGRPDGSRAYREPREGTLRQSGADRRVRAGSADGRQASERRGESDGGGAAHRRGNGERNGRVDLSGAERPRRDSARGERFEERGRPPRGRGDVRDGRPGRDRGEARGFPGREQRRAGDRTGGSSRGRDARPEAQRGGPRLAPTKQRLPEPRIDDDVTGSEIDRSIKTELRTLSKENAKGVGQHLVMVARLLDVDIAAARAHAETAVRRAGRVAAVRETRGLVAYREGDFALALSEFRTARRLTGSQHLLPLMVDCERGLGRPERALELAGSPEARTLGKRERIELLIVCSGIRRDMGHLDAAVVLLETPDLDRNRRDPWSARLFYAYADALLARGDRDAARQWFAEALDADAEHETDAAERLDELDGVVFVDLGADEDEASPTVDAARGDAAAEDEAEAGGEPEAGDAAPGEPGAPGRSDTGVPDEGATGARAEHDAGATDEGESAGTDEGESAATEAAQP